MQYENNGCPQSYTSDPGSAQNFGGEELVKMNNFNVKNSQHYFGVVQIVQSGGCVAVARSSPSIVQHSNVYVRHVKKNDSQNTEM